MANKEMWDYLSEVTPDYNATLDIKRKMEPTEEGGKNQVKHDGDDDSEEVISFSDSSIFYVNIPWEYLTESESGTIWDMYHDPDKGNGIARSFKWIHYGERTDQHTYTVKFDMASSRTMLSGDVHSMKDVRLRVLGRAPA